MAPPHCRTIGEVLLYHINDCVIFQRLLRMGIPLLYAKYVTALWINLDPMGFNLSDRLYWSFAAGDEATVKEYLREAGIIFYTIQRNTPPPLPDILEAPLPLTCAARLPQERHGRFFYKNRHVISPEVLDLLQNGECRLVFDDTLRTLMFGDQNNPILAQNFERGPVLSPVLGRTMLFTVDVDFPFTKEQIRHFFNFLRRVHCVHHVTLEDVVPGMEQRGGSVVFWTAEYLESVLNGQQQATFIIGVNRSLLGFRATDNL